MKIIDAFLRRIWRKYRSSLRGEVDASFRSAIDSTIPALLDSLSRKVSSPGYFGKELLSISASASAQLEQIRMLTHYRDIVINSSPGYDFDDIGFKCYSQNSEDGILLYIFSIIGTTNKVAVEICAGNGIECNSANLIINHGWWALLFDGSAENIAMGTKFFRTNPRCFIRAPRLVQAWITRDNVNALIGDNGVSGEIDLLTVDVDGNDYWMWDSINIIKPRVVVVECQANNWGYDRAVTMPYQEDFVADFSEGGSTYCGASLPAFVNLARKKGYYLVGVERYGFNAFFVRADISSPLLPEKSAKECLAKVFKTFIRVPASPSFHSKPWEEV